MVTQKKTVFLQIYQLYQNRYPNGQYLTVEFCFQSVLVLYSSQLDRSYLNCIVKPLLYVFPIWYVPYLIPMYVFHALVDLI